MYPILAIAIHFLFGAIVIIKTAARMYDMYVDTGGWGVNEII